MKLFIAINLILIFLVACSEKQKDAKTPNHSAEELTKKASNLLLTNPDSAMILLDQAIAVDKNYDKAYSNKVPIYLQRKEYQKAIEATEKIVSLKPNCAECYLSAGMLYDILKEADKASEYYAKSIEIFDARIVDPQKAEMIYNNKLNRILALFMLDKKAEANSEIEKLKAEYPDDDRINMYEDFDKKEFISTIFNE